jgi:CRISPR/Cas system-associated endoribonuclease Cas2
MMDDPAVKKECRRIQASFYAEVLQTHTTDSPTSAMFFFNKAESIMKLLHMSPTKMDFKMRTIKTFEDIDLAADEIQNAMYEGLLEKIEFEQLKEILELKRKTYETRDVIVEIEELKKRFGSE